MLQLTNVTVSSPSKVILDQLSLTVSAGEAVGIVGESGSGKDFKTAFGSSLE